MTNTVDSALLELLPHRPPMLLLSELLAVTSDSASAAVNIDENSPFFMSTRGVPACIGLEYMGQTAALIAGHQLRQGLIEPHLGFLLGSRKFNAYVSSFPTGSLLRIDVHEGTVVDQSLANFNCTLTDRISKELLCEATLSVLRKPLTETMV